MRTLARVLGADFARIQFTPDLMPADITGTNVFNLQRNEFSLIKGPIFTSFLLADEINRAPAKTQSALLQAMQERVVTIDRETHSLPPMVAIAPPPMCFRELFSGCRSPPRITMCGSSHTARNGARLPGHDESE